MKRSTSQALVVLVAILTYARTVTYTFVLDDHGIIAGNALVHHWSGLWRGFVSPYWPPPLPGGQYRPLALATFTLQWMIGHGSPVVFHLVNIIEHAIVVALVWQLLNEWLSESGALIGALIFAVQPVHVEAVANGVGQCDLLMTACVLAALLAHRKGQWRAIPLFAAALLSKESGVVFIGLACMSDLFDRRWRRPGLYAGYGAVTLCFLAAYFTVCAHSGLSIVADVWQGTTWLERWLTMLSVVPEYVRLMVAPFRLRIEYGPQDILIADHVTSAVLLGSLTLVLLIGVAVFSYRRAPLITLGLCWFAIALSPVSNIFFPSGVLLAERTLYLPSVGAVILWGWAADRLLAIRPRVWWPAAVCWVLVLGFWADHHGTWWRNDKDLVVASLHDDPFSFRMHYRAGVILQQVGDSVTAAREFVISRTLFTPRNADVPAASSLRNADVPAATPRNAISKR